jgi:hypothetical protein
MARARRPTMLVSGRLEAVRVCVIIIRLDRMATMTSLELAISEDRLFLCHC